MGREGEGIRHGIINGQLHGYAQMSCKELTMEERGTIPPALSPLPWRERARARERVGRRKGEECKRARNE